MGLAKDQKDDIDAAFARYRKGGSIDVAKKLGPAIRSARRRRSSCRATWKSSTQETFESPPHRCFSTHDWTLEASSDSGERLLLSDSCGLHFVGKTSMRTGANLCLLALCGTQAQSLSKMQIAGRLSRGHAARRRVGSI
jgi:hypothetical protein